MEVDIYGDLDVLDNQFDVVQQENEQLKEAVQKLEETSIKFSIEIKELKKINSNLEFNISTLFKTAKSELERKNKQIAELRKELDTLVFRRGSNKKNTKQFADESKEKQISEQFEKAKLDLEQKNRIINSLNLELNSVRREVGENHSLKRNSLQMDDAHNYKMKKPKMERLIENEDDYRDYRNRHEMREMGYYNSRSKSSNYQNFRGRERGRGRGRGRGHNDNDLRSRIALKRRSRSTSKEDFRSNDPRLNRERYRYAQHKGSYCENNSLEYERHYGNEENNERQNVGYELGEEDSGIFSSQTIENSYETMGTEAISPDFINEEPEEGLQKSKISNKNKQQIFVEKEMCNSDTSENNKEIKIENNSSNISKELVRDDKWSKNETESKVKIDKPESEKNKETIPDSKSAARLESKNEKITSSYLLESSKSKDERAAVIKNKSIERSLESVSEKTKQQYKIPKLSSSNISIVPELQSTTTVKRETKISESTKMKVVSEAQPTNTKHARISLAETSNSNLSPVCISENIKKSDTKEIKKDVLLPKQNESTKIKIVSEVQVTKTKPERISLAGTSNSNLSLGSLTENVKKSDTVENKKVVLVPTQYVIDVSKNKQNDNEPPTKNISDVNIRDTLPLKKLTETTIGIADNSAPTPNTENVDNVKTTNDRKPPIRGRRRRCVISIT